jgi:hypothetical protein
MRIIQISTAHHTQGEEPTLYGLGDDGIVYVYRDELKPYKTRENVMVAATDMRSEDLRYSFPIYDKAPLPAPCPPEYYQEQCLNHMAPIDQQMQRHERENLERLAQIAMQERRPGQHIGKGIPGLVGREVEVQIVNRAPAPWSRRLYDEPQAIEQPKITHYNVMREVFKDGWTEGWYPLTTKASKPVPHIEDPTRCERC